MRLVRKESYPHRTVRAEQQDVRVWLYQQGADFERPHMGMPCVRTGKRQGLVGGKKHQEIRLAEAESDRNNTCRKRGRARGAVDIGRGNEARMLNGRKPNSVDNSVPKYNTWDTFIEALIQIESGGDSYAIGQSDDVGVLQIRPIMVCEANRILGIEKYTLDDRYSREKSIEIWNVVQDYHNPEHDIRRALEVHNKYAPKEYVVKVFAKYYELTSRETIAH